MPVIEKDPSILKSMQCNGHNSINTTRNITLEFTGMEWYRRKYKNVFDTPFHTLFG